ncbi:MAG: TolC family protein [Phycisphaerae bacterium]|nr:TolC family protein [Phycisphaerae bacterium]
MIFRKSFAIYGVTILLSLGVLAGCKTPSEYQKEADKVAYDIVTRKQMEALGRNEPFTIERPSDILRRRLLNEQNLMTTGPWSFGTDRLEQIPLWPDPNYPRQIKELDPIVELEGDKPIRLTLLDALQIGARNSFTYQGYKEDVFRAALNLDLNRNNFRDIFNQTVEQNIRSNTTGDRAVSQTDFSETTTWDRTLKNGTSVGAGLAVNLANLLTGNRDSSHGILADASISIPLLRGSGEYNPLNQNLIDAERNVIYQIWIFERNKVSFAVDIADAYLTVLQGLDRIDNAAGNYRRQSLNVRRARRLADAGQIDIIQVGQAVQSELSARNQWILAKQSYESSLDSFKVRLGLPADARIELDRDELSRLVEAAKGTLIQVGDSETASVDPNQAVVAADAPIELVEPSMAGAGRYEIDPDQAVRLALDHRLDLKQLQGKVYDAQREVVFRADRLRAGLDLLGTVSSGGTTSPTSEDTKLRLDKVTSYGLLSLDLPIERTAERNDYRNALIELESATRAVAIREDEIKVAVRGRLRTLLSSRESLQIQAKALEVAQNRVESANISLEAGRAQIRDILEAQDALVSAQNSLTTAVISYRINELRLQQDMDLLLVNEKGLWTEYNPEVTNEKQQ